MKYGLIALAAALLFHPADASPALRNTKDELTPTPSERKSRRRKLADEDELKKALSTLFNPGSYSITNLASKDADGGKELSGTVSFFGNEGVTLTCLINDKRVKTISATFPTSATFTLGHLDKLSQGEFRSLLPASLNTNAGIRIIDFVIHMNDSGKELESFETNLSASDWDFLNFESFKMNALTLKLELFKSQKKLGGELAGDVTIGKLKTKLSATLKPDQSPVFTGVIPGGQGQLNVKEALNSIAGPDETTRFFGLFPSEVFNSLATPQVSLIAIPGDKKMSLSSNTDIGNMEIAVQKKGAKKDIKLIIQPKDLGKLIQTDALKDLQLNNPLVMISASRERSVKVPTFEDTTIDLEEGMNLITTINLGADIEKVFKMAQVNLTGSIDKSKRMKLTAKQEMNLPIGETGIKFEGVSFGLESNPAPKFMMDGTLAIPIDKESTLRFSAGLSTAPVPPQFGGSLTLITETPDGVWRNPLNVPGVGIKNLHGGLMMMPAPPFLSELALEGEILLGKNLDPGGNPIQGALNMRLKLNSPMTSYFEASVKNLTALGIVNAFTDVQLSGEVANLLRSGIDNATISVHPNVDPAAAEVSASGDFSLLGKSAHIQFEYSRANLSASGSMDPWEIKAGDFTVFAVRGAGGNPKPAFALQIGTDPSFSMNGAVTALETMHGSANIVITKTGFQADLTGNIFNGAFTGNLHAYGRNLASDPVIHAELNLSQTVVNDFKVSLKNFIKDQAKNSEKDIVAVRNKVNTGAQFLDDTFKGSLNVVNTLQKGTATAGILIVDNLVPDVTNISFVGDLTSVSTKINVRVDYRAAGQQMPPITITMDLKNPNYQGELDKMAEQMGKEVLNVFSDLGEGVAKLGDAGKELLTDLGKGVITAGKEVGKFAGDAVNEIDKFWNGERFDPVRSGPELEERSIDTRHYSVLIKSVTAIQAEDDPIQEKVAQAGADAVKGIGQATSAVVGAFGASKSTQQDIQQGTTIKLTPDPLIEIYGAIVVVSNNSMRVGDPNTTNSNAWSVNRVDAVKNVSAGRSFNVNNIKHYYAQNGSNPSVTIRSKLKEYDEGEHHDSDGEFSGAVTISNLGSWNWDTGHRIDESFIATTNDGGRQSQVRVDYAIMLEPKISLQQIRQAVATRDINQVSRVLLRGGDIKQGSVLEPAIQNRDVAMINFLLASGANLYDQDLATALQPQFFTEEIATKLIVRKKTPVTSADLDKAIAVNNRSIANLIVSKGIVPTAAQLQNALAQNKLEMADVLLANRAPVSVNDLTNAVNSGNLPVATLLLKYGAPSNVGLLNQALQSGNKAMAQLLLQSQDPDQTSYQLAADKNDLELFNMVASKGVLLQSDGPAQKAIDFNNMALLKQTLTMGGSSSNALGYAVQKGNPQAINTCLELGGNPNLATAFAANSNNTELFTRLIATYHANGTQALSQAIAANNLALAKVALEQGGGNPDVDLKSQADQGKAEAVRLLVDHGGNPNLAMSGTIAANKPDLLKYLIEKGASADNNDYVTKAAELGSLDMTKLLVDNGANPNPGMPIAVSKNNYALTTYLLSAGANVNGFMKAPAAAGNSQMVKILLDNGAAPNEGMASAVEASQLEVAKMLLSYGASTQGHLATPSKGGNVEMVKLLLQYGADPNEGIREAVGANKTEAAVLLLEAGASVRGLMPAAAGYGNKILVQMLLDRGVDATEGIKPAVQKNFTEVAILLLDNNAAIDGMIAIAAANGNESIVSKLLSLGAVANEGIEPAVTNKHTPVAKLLIEAGADVKSSSFMVIAVRNRQEDMVRLLQANKCDVTYTDAKGNSFLHIVSGDDGEYGLAKAFVEFGLNVDQQNIEGDTPLHLAAESGKDNLEVVQLLVEAGADVNAVNKRGDTPRKAAKGRKVKKYLKDNGGARKVRN